MIEIKRRLFLGRASLSGLHREAGGELVRGGHRLRKHFAKIRAGWRPPEGVAEFPESGTCWLVARTDELVLRTEALDKQEGRG